MGYNFTKQTQNETHEKADFTCVSFCVCFVKL